MPKVTLTIQSMKNGHYRFGLNQEGRNIIHPEDLKVEKIYLELQKLNGDKRDYILYETNRTYRNFGNLAHNDISKWIAERINRNALQLRDKLLFDFIIENNGKQHKYVLLEE